MSELSAETGHTAVSIAPTWGQVVTCSCGAEYAPNTICPNSVPAAEFSGTTKAEQKAIYAALDPHLTVPTFSTMIEVIDGILREHVAGNDRMYRALHQAKDRQLKALERRIAAVESLLDETERLASERDHLARLSTKQIRFALAGPPPPDVTSRPAESGGPSDA